MKKQLIITKQDQVTLLNSMLEVKKEDIKHSLRGDANTMTFSNEYGTFSIEYCTDDRYNVDYETASIYFLSKSGYSFRWVYGFTFFNPFISVLINKAFNYVYNEYNREVEFQQFSIAGLTEKVES